MGRWKIQSSTPIVQPATVIIIPSTCGDLDLLPRSYIQEVEVAVDRFKLHQADHEGFLNEREPYL